MIESMGNTRQSFNQSKGIEDQAAINTLGSKIGSPFNQTNASMTSNQNTANLKGKLGSLDVT